MSNQNNSSFADILRDFLNWLREAIPPFLVGLGIGNKLQSKKVNELDKENQELKLENKKLENKNEVEKEYSNSSDSDVIRDAIRKGRRLGGEGSESDS